MVKRRYTAGIQRVKGLLQVASALYDSSLSFETTRAAEGVLQTGSRLGRALRLSLAAGKDPKNISLSFATGGLREITALAEGKFSLVWMNPSAMLTMAYRGTGPFRKRLPLRTIGVFPSYDAVCFAVHESTGITSLAQIKTDRMPLSLSTGPTTPRLLRGNATMITVTAVLGAAGLTLADLRKWGGTIQPLPGPSYPARRAGIESGEVNAVFDEGVKSWGRTALGHGFRCLPIEGNVLKRMVALGYRPATLSKSRFPELPEEVQTLDFSGWPMAVRADMPADVAYALCEAIEKSKDLIPTDNFKPLDIAQLCADDEEAPNDVPLHPGAARFYRERGYLK
jgi:TRAP-type uncharacterized transport system substrate-binding protein